MSKQLGFLLDQRYCIGCQGCQTACVSRNASDPGEFLRIADNFENVDKDTYYTGSCHHCAEPACATVCPVKAISKDDENGIVSTDYDICIGCKACIKACPYDSPKYNETTKKSHKCDFCKDRIEGGDVPACVEACPMKVLTFGNLEELKGIKQGDGFIIEKTNPSYRFIVK